MSAEYPNAVKNFLILEDGVDKVLAAHPNDRANEITALETFLGASGGIQSHSTDLLTILAGSYLGGRCYKKDADEIYVSAFFGIIPNATGTIKKLRAKSTVTTLTAANIDTGAFAAATYYYIYATADTASTEPVFVISASASAPTGYTNYLRLGWFYNETISVIDITGGKISTFIGGNNQTQVITYQTGAVSSGDTAIPFDDSKPTKTEGISLMEVVIIPTLATSKLRIDIIGNLSGSSEDDITMSLLQDDITDALAANSMSIGGSTMAPISLSHIMTSGTTSPITFKVRAGRNAGATTTFNGTGGARKFAGICASRITVTETRE